ncbi:MAG: hypothetical protein ACRDAM_06955 [Casimicrobium sp.]
MGLFVTLFTPPHGNKQSIEVTNVRAEDEQFFKTRGINLSMETLGNGEIAVYADTGARINNDPNEDPDELIELSMGRSCEDTFAALRKSCEERDQQAAIAQ